MTLTIRPDPARPSGGYAILRFSQAPQGLPDQLTVAVKNPYGGGWLAPEAEGKPSPWQTARFEFGPYPLRRGEGFVEVTVGPEVVNRQAPYSEIEVFAGPLLGTCRWPEEIMPLERASGRTGMTAREPQVAAAPVAPPAPPKAPQPHVITPTAPPPLPPQPAPTQQSPEPLPSKAPRRGPAVIGGILALLLLLVGGYFAWRHWAAEPVAPPSQAEVQPEPVPEPEPEPEPEPATPPEQAAPAPDLCNIEALGAQPNFGQMLNAAAGCSGRLSRDGLLSLIEAAAARNDGEALLLFGALYDAEITDPIAEGTLNLTFGDVPAQAADYYHRARSVAAAGASARLTAVCTRLSEATDTLSRGAHDDFCR